MKTINMVKQNTIQEKGSIIKDPTRIAVYLPTIFNTDGKLPATNKMPNTKNGYYREFVEPITVTYKPEYEEDLKEIPKLKKKMIVRKDKKDKSFDKSKWLKQHYEKTKR